MTADVEKKEKMDDTQTLGPRTAFIVNVTALVRVLAWPIVVIICLIYLITPVRMLLGAVPAAIERAQTINVGGVVLTFAASDLPTPSEEVSAVLRQLNPNLLREVVSSGDDTRDCISSNMPPSVQALRQKLTTLGLMQTRNDGVNDCIHYYTFTPLGMHVRAFLINLLAAQFKLKSEVDSN